MDKFKNIRNRGGFMKVILLALLLSFLLIPSVLSVCDSFEPMGACPETDLLLRDGVTYTNTLREDANYWYFDYNGSDIDITYNINKDILDFNGSTLWSPIHSGHANGFVTVGNDVNGIDKRLSLWDPLFEFQNGSKHVQVWGFETLALRNITQASFTNEGLKVTYLWSWADKSGSDQYNNILDTEILNWTINIKGKALIVHVQGQNNNFYKATWDSVEVINGELRPVWLDNATIGTSGAHDIVISNNTIFYNADLIIDKSDFSEDFSTVHSVNVNSKKVNYFKGSVYNNLTNGQRNNVNDTYFIVMSDNIMDVLLFNKNSKSTKYNDIRGNWLYRLESFNNIQDSWNLTQRYANYGFDMNAGIIDTQVFTSVNPSHENYTGSYNRDYIGQLGINLTSLGLEVGMYNSLQDIYTSSLFYNGTGFVNSTNHSMIMRESNNSLVESFLSGSLGQAYASRYERRQDMLNYMFNNLSNDWKHTYLFLDTEGASTFNFVDYDYNESMKGMIRGQFPSRDQFFDTIRGYDKFVIAENFNGLWTAGSIDAGVGSQCCSDTSLNFVIPDYTISQMTNKQLMFAEYLQYFMYNWNGSENAIWGQLTDEKQHDKYIVQSISYRMLVHLDKHMGEKHNIPDNRTILTYYMWKRPSELYYSYDPTNLSYYDDSQGYMTLSHALRQEYAFANPRIYQKYGTNLHVYVNLNQSGWWNLTINGKMRNIAPNGYYMYQPNVIEAFYNDNNQSHWIQTSGWAYLYPKNDQTITFDVWKNSYTPQTFYGNDQGNGKLEYQSTEIITVYETKDATYLERSQYSAAILQNSQDTCRNVAQGFELSAIIPLVLMAAIIISLLIITKKNPENPIQVLGVALFIAMMSVISLLVINQISLTC